MVGRRGGFYQYREATPSSDAVEDDDAADLGADDARRVASYGARPSDECPLVTASGPE